MLIFLLAAGMLAAAGCAPASKGEEYMGNLRLAPYSISAKDGIAGLTYFSARTIEGARTSFQSAAGYDPAMRIPADSVMVYATNPSDVDGTFARWEGMREYYNIDMMIAANRGTEYLALHPEKITDIQKNSAGEYIEHSHKGSGVYYMVPTADWVEYIWSVVEKAIPHNPGYIAVEEPEMWHSSGYSDGFKDEWQKYYGEDWTDPASSPEARYKSEKLKTWLFERLLSTIAQRLDERAPEIKLYIASHSTPNYNNYGITAGLNQYMDIPGIDGVIAQVWSDTAMAPVPYAGTRAQRVFEEAYVEYASMGGSVSEGQRIFYLADPKADNGSLTWEAYRTEWQRTVVASLLRPEAERFEVLPWPDRSFLAAPGEYKTEQLAVFQLLGGIGGLPALVTAGTPGISIGLSDTMSWQHGVQGASLSSDTAFYGMSLPLVEKGIPVNFTPLDKLKSAKDLEDVRVLILSYDTMKPVSETVNQAIADWVRAGGVLLCLGGHDAYESLPGEWWAKDGGTPLSDLFARAGVQGIQITAPEIQSGERVTWAGTEEYMLAATEETSLWYVYEGFAAGFEGGGFTALMTGGDTVYGAEMAAGSGAIIAVGLPGSYYGDNVDGPELLRGLVRFAVEKAGYEYRESAGMKINRGPFIAGYALEDGFAVAGPGRYIDLFDPELTVLDQKVLNAGESALLYDISGLEDKKIPRLAYTGGDLEEKAVETAEKTEFSISGPEEAVLAARLVGGGLVPQKISVTRNGQEQDFIPRWENAGGSLLLLIPGDPEPAEVVVEWGKAPRADDPAYIYRSLSVETNEKNLDSEYLVRTNAGINSWLRFADMDTEIVYKFDISVPGVSVSLNVLQNYLIEVSGDDSDYKKVINYREDVNPEHVTDGSNSAVVVIRPGDFGLAGDAMYVRIRNTDITKGWGGSISGFTLRWKGEK